MNSYEKIYNLLTEQYTKMGRFAGEVERIAAIHRIGRSAQGRTNPDLHGGEAEQEYSKRVKSGKAVELKKRVDKSERRAASRASGVYAGGSIHGGGSPTTPGKVAVKAGQKRDKERTQGVAPTVATYKG